MIKRLFTEHPATVGESYFQHLGVALSFAGTFAFATLACFIHAFLPFLFVKTGSNIISNLHQRMVSKRHEQTSPNKKSIKNQATA